MNPYSSLCDDFGVYVYVNTKMDLPSGRETVLHFFESLRKTFPQMTDFDCRDNGEYVYTFKKNGKRCAYEGVPEDVAIELSKAPSVGQMLNSEIKGQYPFRYV